MKDVLKCILRHTFEACIVILPASSGKISSGTSCLSQAAHFKKAMNQSEAAKMIRSLEN